MRAPTTLTVFLLAASSFAAAQVVRDQPAPGAATTARVSGRVLAADSGKPLQNAVVAITLSGPGGNWRSVSTDADGRWELRDLTPGTYWISVTKAGYIRVLWGQRSRRAGLTPQALSTRQNRRQYRGDRGDERRHLNAKNPKELAIHLAFETLEPLVDFLETSIEPELEVLEPAINPMKPSIHAIFQTHDRLADAVNHLRVLPDPTLDKRDSLINRSHRSPPPYRRRRPLRKRGVREDDA